MNKIAILVLAGTDGKSNLGRAVNAMQTTKEFKEGNDDVRLLFDGAGTQWIPQLDDEDNDYHALWAQVKDKVAGACSYCANAFDVSEEIQEADVPLLDDYQDHPSVRSLVNEGYQILTF